MSLLRRLPGVLTAAALGAAVVTLGAAPAGASAAAPWTAPVTIPGASAQPAPLIITGDGHAIAFPATPLAPTDVVPLDLGSGAPDGPIRGVGIANPMAVAYSRDHWVLAGSTLDADGTISDRSHVVLGYGHGASDLGPLKGIPGSTGRHAFGLAANDDGVVALVIGDTTERRLLIRRPNGRGFVQAFAAKVGSQGRGATVAVGAKGDVLMVWENRHHLYARHVGPSGSVGAVHHVGDGVQSHLQAAVEAGGRLMIAWASQRVGEGDAHTPASINFVTAAPGKAFNKARHLEDAGVNGTGRYVSDPAVRLVTGGASLLAWTGYDAATSHYVVRVTQLNGGRLGPVETVSGTAANAVLGDLAVADDGGAAVIWRTGVAGADPDGGAQTIAATTRADASAPFIPAETIATAAAPSSPGTTSAPAPTANPAPTSFPYAPAIALAPTTGAALAEIGSFAGTASLFQVAARPAP